MEGCRPDRCLICYREFSGGGDLLKGKWSSLSMLSKQMEVIFTLRNVLEIPEEKVSRFLGECGSNPSEWIRLCEECEESVGKARRVYEEVLEVQRRFRGVQQEVIRMVKRSCEERNGERRKKRRKYKSGDPMIITDECREIVRSQVDIDYFTDPFIVGDLNAGILAADLIVKQEVVLDNHAENLTGMDDEDDQEWPLPKQRRPSRKSKSVKKRPLQPKRRHKSLSEEDEDQNPKTEHSSQSGYSRQEFLKMIKTLRKEEDSKKCSEISVLCPLCNKFQCTALQCDKLCEHLKVCEMNGENATLSCPACHDFTRRGADQYVEFSEHLTKCITGGDLPHLEHHLFLCDICDEDERKWMKVHEFLEHYLYHTRYRFKCTKCNHRFCAQASKYTHYHFNVHHLANINDDPSSRSIPDKNLPQVTWWCPACSEKFPTYEERDQHYDLMHGLVMEGQLEKSHVCQWCSKNFFCSEELTLHQGIHHVYDEKHKSQQQSELKKVRCRVLKRKRAQSESEDEDHSDNQNEEKEESDGDENWNPPDADENLNSETDISKELQIIVEEEIAQMKDKVYTKKIFRGMVKRLLDKNKQKKLRAAGDDINTVDKNKSFKCNICPEQEEMKLEQFLDHYLHHKRRIYRCTKCSHRFPSSASKDTNSHFKSNHSEFLSDPAPSRCFKDPVLPEYLWRCFHCNETFSKETERHEHLVEVHSSETSPTNLKCNCCSNAYQNLEEFLVHIADAHVLVAGVRTESRGVKLALPKCSICVKEFPNSILLSDHQKELHKHELFICNCGKLCKSAYGLRSHSIHCKEATLKHEPLIDDHKSESPSWIPSNSKPKTRNLDCPLCNDSKTKSGLGERLCKHLDTCRKKLEWEEQGGKLPELLLECIYCNEYKTEFENKIEFVHHITWCKREEDEDVNTSNRLRSRIFECSLCTKSKVYMKTDAFLIHYMYHKLHHYRCTHCSDLFPSTEAASSHYVLNHPTLLKDTPPSSRVISDPSLPHFTWLCHFCFSQFPSDDLRDSHILSEHPHSKTSILTPATSLSGSVKAHRCVQCPKAFDFLVELRLHEGTAHLTDSSDYPCDQCPAILKSPKLLRQHKHDKHQAGIVICEICGSEMKGIHLKNHMQSHQDIRSHICDHPQCGESFSTTQMLKLHTFRKHAPLEPGKNPLVCPQCPEPKVFHDRSYLRMHIRQVHLKAHDLVCHLCGKGFQYNYHLQKHLCKSHKIGTVGLFQCNVDGCSKKFYEKVLYKQHLDMHRGEPEFKCEVCGKEFYFKNRLRRHELIHKNADTKPYQCEICAKRFPVHNYLYIHMRSHKKRGEV